MAEPELSSVNPVYLTADAHNIASGKSTFLEGLGSALTYGVAASITSGVNGLINTGIAGINWATGDNIKELDTQQILRDFDSDLGKYYQENKAGVDIAGFVGTAFAPGLGGIKVLRLMQNGKFGNATAAATGLLKSSYDDYLKLAVTEMQNSTNTFKVINGNKLKMLGAGFGSEALDAAAFEIAVAATMNQSPILEDMSVKDLFWNGVAGMAVGGLLGGAIKGAIGLRTISKATGETDLSDHAFRHLSFRGDDATPAQNIVLLARSKFGRPTSGTDKQLQLAIEANNHADSLIGQQFQKLAQGDADIAVQLSQRVVNGADASEVAANVAGLVKAERIGMDDALVTGGQFERVGQGRTRLYVIADDTGATITHGEKVWATSDLQEARRILDTHAKGSRIKVIGDEIDETLGKYAASDDFPGFTTRREVEYLVPKNALRSGRVKELSDLRKTPEPLRNTDTVILNLRTGEYTTRAIPGIVDLMQAGEKVQVTHQGLLAGKTVYTGVKDYVDVIGADLLEVNARQVYTMLDSVPMKNGSTVHQFDVPMLEKALRSADVDTLHIAEGARTLRTKDEIADYLYEVKQRLSLEGIEKGMDEVELAYRLNITREFLEDPSKGFIRESPGATQDFLKPSYAKLHYDTATIKDAAGDTMRGEALIQAQMNLAQDRIDSVFLHLLKDQAPELLPDAKELYYLLREANREGAGATLFGFAHGEYGSLASQMERIGLFVDKASKARVEAMRVELEKALAPILRNENLTAELAFTKAMVQRNPEKYVLHFDKDGNASLRMLEAMTDPKYKPAFNAPAKMDLSPELAEFMKVHVGLNEPRRDAFRTLRASAGLTDANAAERAKLPVVYFPPINTKEYKFFALVRQHDGLGVQPHTGVIVSSTAEGLSKKIDELSRRPEFQNLRFIRKTGKDAYGEQFGQVITKLDSIEYHKALGDYEYQLGLNDNLVDVTMRRAGSLSDVIPPAGPGSAEKIATEFLDWHAKQETALVREAVDHRYSAVSQELKQLGQRYGAVEGSRFQDVGQAMINRADNPFEDYRKTMLNISRSAEYAPWRSLNEWVETAFSGTFKSIREAFGKISTMTEEEATKFNTLAGKYGLGQPYRTGMEYVLANEIAQRPYLGRFVARAQAILSGTILQADPLNALNNIVGSPIMYGAEMSNILRAIEKGNPEIAGKLADLRSIAVPGTGGQNKLPTTWKILGNSIKMYFDDARNGGALLDEFAKSGVVSDVLYQHRQMLDAVTLRGDESIGLLNKHITTAMEIAGKVTGNKFAEQFTRFTAAASMKQLTDLAIEAGVMSSREAGAYIQTFVNRVQGNYLASQRPVIFQGVLGQAIGLFQTYQFNLLQNLLRYAGTAESRAAITLTALQGTIYGMQGLPAFNAINTHLVGNASGNPTHKDLYTAAYSVAGKEAGDWLMYGLGSNALSLFNEDLRFNLYSRGDINPRQITVLPVNPMDVPLVKATANFYNNFMQTAERIGQGAPIKESLLQGLEHNGLNRPLAGLAQVLQGYTTTSKGSLLSSIDQFDIANASRVLGGKPFDEALALDALYRVKAYQAKDRARREELGAVVKTTLLAGQDPTDDQIQDFMLKYAKTGGRQDNFSAFMVEQMKGATVSQVNKLRDKLNNPMAQNMMVIMGGERLPDFMGKTLTSARIGEDQD